MSDNVSMPLQSGMAETANGALPVDRRADLDLKYRGLLAREKRYQKSITDLTQQRSRNLKTISELQRRLNETATELDAVRRSWRYRLGTLVLSPLTFLRALASKGLRAVREPSPVATQNAPVQSPKEKAAEPTLKDLERALAEAPSADKAFIYANSAYYLHGHVESAQRAIAPYLDADLTSRQRHLAKLIGGLHRLLTQGLSIPPRQPNANLLTDAESVLYCVHSAMPYLTNGYSTRTHGVSSGARLVGVRMAVAARPGFPWDTKGAASVDLDDARQVRVLDGVPYVFNPGLNLERLPLDHYIEAAADEFLREAIRQRAGLIHAASNHINGLAALIAARRLGVPFVYEVRGLWEVTQASERQGWSESDRYVLAVKLETMVAREADRVLAITEELKQELVARGVSPDRIELLPNCVDTERFAPIEADARLMTKLGFEAGVPTVGFAGSVVRYEGLELLAQALGRLHAEGLRFNLLIVGDGTGLAALKQAVAAAGIKERTHFTGRVPRDDVRNLMSCMDVMPCPRTASAVTEMVSPLKPLEAMAMGKAVLLSDVAPHLVFAGEHQERARLFAKDDVNDLASKLRELLQDAPMRSELGRAGRLWVAQHRTWAVSGEVLKRAYVAARVAARLAVADDSVEPAKRLANLHIALIADRFTTDAFGPDTQLHRPTPENWRSIFDAAPVDALIVESAWEGNAGAWHRRVGFYSDEEMIPLRELVAHCRANDIPTLFWNKEDPVHFKRFEQTAALFDHVFTTDNACIVRYLATHGTRAKTASALPFFAQPKVHNPLPSTMEWMHDACYAGSYYGDRYPERSKRLDTLLVPAAELGLTIYDRQHFSADSPYRFPDHLASFVKGGLDYADMVQAYKAHAVQLNVNSVDTSSTMFSRRVMEIAASGVPLLSSPSRGVAETMAGTVTVAADEQEVRSWLRLWLHDELARHAAILPPMREVFRAHTAAHRLTQMLRTAGLRIVAPELPAYALVCDTWDARGLSIVEKQTHRPRLVLAGRVDAPAPEGTVILDAHTADLSSALARNACKWVGYLPADLTNERDECFYEDLLVCSLWSDAPAIAQRRVACGGQVAGPRPLVEMDQPVQLTDGLVRVDALPKVLSGAADFASMNGLQIRGLVRCQYHIDGSTNSSVTTAAVAVPKTILVAGHDLKFLRQVMSHWERQGHHVLVDAWPGHNRHDEARSSELLAQADVIFCEWCLGNAVWYSRHRRPDQRLVVRFHLQELLAPYAANVRFDAVDTTIFVGAHIRDTAVRRLGLEPARTQVVPNYVGDNMFVRRKEGDHLHTIGFVGITPQRKRLDLALDLLKELRKNDTRYRLCIKGHRPEEYDWMRARTDEMRYYEKQYQRISDDPLLVGAVAFEGHGDDMAQFYSRIGFALSVSDFESFHLTIADGAAARAIPLVLDWEGADRIYPAQWLRGDVAGLALRAQDLVLDSDRRSRELDENVSYVREHFATAAVFGAIDRVCFPMESNAGQRRPSPDDVSIDAVRVKA